MRKLLMLCFKLLIPFGIIAIGIELTSYLYFVRLMSASERNDLLFVLRGITEDSAPNLLPSIRPYLWSNYQPSPGTRHANQYGWRYGGGPKTNAVRILCLGGSTTWSLCASDPTYSYPAVLERYLRSRGFSVDVVNGGCPYYTTAEMVIPFHLWTPSRDDLRVDQCHLNDEGCREKAEYIGSWLVERGYLDGDEISRTEAPAIP